MSMEEFAKDFAESRSAEEWMEEWLRCVGDNARLEDKCYALRKELVKARVLVERWCHYQGNSQDLHDTYLAPIDKILNNTE